MLMRRISYSTFCCLCFGVLVYARFASVSIHRRLLACLGDIHSCIIIVIVTLRIWLFSWNRAIWISVVSLRPPLLLSVSQSDSGNIVSSRRAAPPERGYCNHLAGHHHGQDEFLVVNLSRFGTTICRQVIEISKDHSPTASRLVQSPLFLGKCRLPIRTLKWWQTWFANIGGWIRRIVVEARIDAGEGDW